jgi:hypothetical protein
MVQQHIGQLLPPVAAAAHTAQKAIQTLRGLLTTTQHATRAAEFARTLAQARWLCSLAGKQAGLQVTAADLVAAARGRVEGLESWLVEPYCSKQCWQEEW